MDFVVVHFLRPRYMHRDRQGSSFRRRLGQGQTFTFQDEGHIARLAWESQTFPCQPTWQENKDDLFWISICINFHGVSLTIQYPVFAKISLDIIGYPTKITAIFNESLKLTISNLKTGYPKRKQSYSNHPFSGCYCMLVKGRVIFMTGDAYQMSTIIQISSNGYFQLTLSRVVGDLQRLGIKKVTP